jgi:hypothetical protein
MKSPWKIVGGAILAMFAVGTIWNYKSLRRYIRISTM